MNVPAYDWEVESCSVLDRRAAFAGGISTSSSSSVYSARHSIIASGLFSSFGGCVIVVFAVVSESLGVSVWRVACDEQ